jgi:hypothetical protein
MILYVDHPCNVAAVAALRATLPRTLLSGVKIISKESCKIVRPSNNEKELKIEKGNKSERKETLKVLYRLEKKIK